MYQGIVFYLMLFLLIAILASFVVLSLERWCWSKRRAPGAKASKLVLVMRDYLPVFIIVFIIRAFIVQPYRVPTGSLEPTVLPGDFLIVSQFSYGLRLPFTYKKILPTSEPKRGDIALFYYPPNTNMIFVKRVVGLPGDHIQYKNKVLFVNGKMMKQKFVGTAFDYGDAPGQLRAVNVYTENLGAVKHRIFIQPEGGETQNIDVTVPKGNYFMMGDNRDDSGDSREWGFVPENHLIGSPLFILFSWDPVHSKLRWKRSFHGVH